MKDLEKSESQLEEEKKQFSREQWRFLEERVSDMTQVSRIFKAAGPGQVQEAWKLAHCEDWSTEDGEVRKDLLDCILSGAGGSQRFGWERMTDVLEEAGFYAPAAYSSKCFFRVLFGALEVLVPGSFNFSKSQLEEIELTRRNNVQYNKVKEVHDAIKNETVSHGDKHSNGTVGEDEELDDG